MFVGRGTSGGRGNGYTSHASPARIFASLSQKTHATADGLDIAGGDVYRKCYNDVLERLSGAGADAMSDADRAEGKRRQILPTNFSDAMLDPIGRLVDRLWHALRCASQNLSVRFWRASRISIWICAFKGV